MKKRGKRFLRQALCIVTLLSLLVTMPEGFDAGGRNTDVVFAANSAPLPDSYKFYVDGTSIKCDFTYSTDRTSFRQLYFEYARSEDGPWYEAAFSNYWSAGEEKTMTWSSPDIGTTYYVRLRAENDSSYYYPVETISDVQTFLISEPKLDPPEWITSSCKAYINTCRLTWKVSRKEGISYNVYRSTKKGSGYKKIATLPLKLQSDYIYSTQWLTYYDTTAKPQTTYYYKIATVNAEGKAGKKSSYLQMKTAKKSSGSDSVKIPDFASYAGIEGVATTEKNCYGEKYKKIVYTDIEWGMFEGYAKLLSDSTYQLKKIYTSGNGMTYYFDYKGTGAVKHGKVVGDYYLNYGKADVCISYGTNLMVLEYSPTLKLATVKKDKRYDPSSASSEEPGSSSGSGISSSTSKTKCSYCSNGLIKCKSCTNGFYMCSSCNGTGTYYSSADKKIKNCTRCNGGGKVKCTKCGGTGYTKCTSCGGDGWK